MNKSQKEELIKGNLTKEEVLRIKNDLKYKSKQNAGFLIGAVIVIIFLGSF